VEKMASFLVRSGTTQGYSLSLPLFSIVLEVLARKTNKKEKKSKCSKICLLFLYVKSFKDSTHTHTHTHTHTLLVELTNESSKDVGLKINIQKLYFYTPTTNFLERKLRKSHMQ
jgi:hypothetical protein